MHIIAHPIYKRLTLSLIFVILYHKVLGAYQVSSMQLY